ncbi:MAG: replication-associated recombination protein A [Planctomycetia bacterium]|nr:replication-associated recombination protein A [Planctomycetia bacterium]
MAKSLFEQSEAVNLRAVQPLAARMRPRTLDEFAGQQHFLGEGKLLRRLLKANRLGSVIFYGPPGTGKTTLAQLLASETKSRFRQLSAVTSGVKDLREVLQEARDEAAIGGRRTLLFIDELHRFNKTQQDALLPDVEEGIVTLVGATTANPFFAVVNALVSRSQIFQFQPLSPDDIKALLLRAIGDRERGLARHQVEMAEDALSFLADVCDGDARRALSALEIGVLSSDERPLRFTRELAEESVQRRAVEYDATGDSHYDAASALIKSIRGSDPDAGLYWLARMLEAGEDIRFLCRRLVILASEDVGNADPQALPLAVAAMQACEFIGLPECQLTLSQCVTYLACAPKSNATTVAIGEALGDVREGRLLPVLGHGVGYEYSHHAEDGVAAQDYLGVEREYYRPVDRGFEKELAERLAKIRAKLREGRT